MVVEENVGKSVVLMRMQKYRKLLPEMKEQKTRDRSWKTGTGSKNSSQKQKSANGYLWR